MTLLDLRNKINELLKENPETGHKLIVQWDKDCCEYFPVEDIYFLETLDTKTIDITLY